MFTGDFFVEQYDSGDVDGLLDGKADTDHNHQETDITDIDKYSQSEADALLAVKAPKLIEELVKPSTGILAAAEISGTVISNFGQAAENTQTLPPAAAGMNFIVIVGTAGAGALHVKADASDKIYLDGTALDDGDKVSCAAPAVGDYITLWTFKTGASVYDWIAAPGQGEWTDGGA